MVCQDEPTKYWVASQAPTMVAWEGSRLKVVGLGALPTYNGVVAWFLGPVEGMERLLSQLRRLNWGLDTESLCAQGGTEWGPPCAQY
jgi:hypothetical protein